MAPHSRRWSVVSAGSGATALSLAPSRFLRSSSPCGFGFVNRQWVRVLGVCAFLLVVAQALLGRFTVKTFLAPPVSAAHATLAEIFFIVTVSLAVFTGKWWTGDVPQLRDEDSPKLRTLTALTSLLILVQIVLGAAFRHNAFGIVPHLIGAGVVT